MPSGRQGGRSGSAWAALAAVGLAAVAGLWLAFYPNMYTGVSATSSSGGEVLQSTEHASLIAENGTWVIGLLLVPVALAGLGLFGATKGRRRLVWIAAIVLLGFSLVSGFSIGLFYVPAAFALLAAAILHGSPQAQVRV